MSYGERLLTLDIFSRFLRNDLVMTRKIFEGLCPGLENLLVLEYNVWNALPEKVVMSTNLSQFKRNLTEALRLFLYEFL